MERGLGFVGKQGNINRVAGHQVIDELFADHRDMIGGGEIDIEKMVADGIPERTFPVVVYHAAHFGDDHGVEIFDVIGHEEEAREREEGRPLPSRR